jgi:hypothetical protein
LWGAIRESLKKGQKIGHFDTLEALALTGWAKAYNRRANRNHGYVLAGMPLEE